MNTNSFTFIVSDILNSTPTMRNVINKMCSVAYITREQQEQVSFCVNRKATNGEDATKYSKTKYLCAIEGKLMYCIT